MHVQGVNWSVRLLLSLLSLSPENQDIGDLQLQTSREWHKTVKLVKIDIPVLVPAPQVRQMIFIHHTYQGNSVVHYDCPCLSSKGDWVINYSLWSLAAVSMQIHAHSAHGVCALESSSIVLRWYVLHGQGAQDACKWHFRGQTPSTPTTKLVYK